MEKMMKQAVPLGRAGTKFEIATSAIFLVCNEYITGQDLIVDGGNWLMKPMSLPREMVSAISKGVEKRSRAMGPGDEDSLKEKGSRL